MMFVSEFKKRSERHQKIKKTNSFQVLIWINEDEKKESHDPT